jgi:hypothetical protein
MEQGARASTMLAMLETLPALRLDRCMSSMYFLGRFHSIWGASISEAHRILSYQAQPADFQSSTLLEAYQLTEEQLDEVNLTTDPLTLLAWKPTAQFTAATKYLADHKPLLIPCVSSLPAVPLTCHYCLWLSNALYEFGFPMYALFCLGFVRSVLMFLPNDGLSSGKDAVLACAHFKVGSLLFLGC